MYGYGNGHLTLWEKYGETENRGWEHKFLQHQGFDITNQRNW